MRFFDEVIDPAWLSAPRSASPDPPWLGPPYDVLPAHVETHLELTRTIDLAVWITGAAVFPCGVSFELQVRWSGGRQVHLPLVAGDRGRNGLCLGALFDDGRRALAVPLRRHSAEFAPAQSLVAAPLRTRQYQVTNEIWMWPLPNVSVTWVLEWRAQRVGESRVRFDTSGINDAARDSRPVWPMREPAAV